jgi:F-type H+-transporting ATPase subunit epsilon
VADERKRLQGTGDAGGRKRLPRPDDERSDGPAGLAKFLGVNLVTPRGVVTHEDSDAITAPGELGEFELLPGHVAKLTALRPGVLTVGEKHRVRYACSAGYLRIDSSSKVEILVEEAVLGSEVDVEAARADLKVAEADLTAWSDRPVDENYRNLVHRVQWAQARIDAAGH